MPDFIRITTSILSIGLGLLASLAEATEPCRIEVFDSVSGWPVPLVLFTTTNHVTFVTDNAGVIAMDDPSLMHRDVWFHVVGHGYAKAADGFGFQGIRLKPIPGATLRVPVKRISIAKRIGRLTGIGLFAESQKLGQMQDFVDGPVVGCDSIQIALHRDSTHWLWGDTQLTSYPLGIFHMSGATTADSKLPTLPPLLPPYRFLVEEGKPRGLAVMPGQGPTWLTQVASLPDQRDEHRLVATYRKITAPLNVNEIGLCVWDDEQQQFRHHKRLWSATENAPEPKTLAEGHATFWKDSQGKSFLLFGNPLPHVRLPASFEAWEDQTQWELVPQQESLTAAQTGEQVIPHSGSIAWSAFRKRWVTVFTQKFGKPSAFGTVWYAEATSPLGPWGPAVQLLSHENYTFYNPRIHAESLSDSPTLLFEGTYSADFADRPTRTARYDYNQILYRVDLDDAMLKPAHAM